MLSQDQFCFFNTVTILMVRMEMNNTQLAGFMWEQTLAPVGLCGGFLFLKKPKPVVNL